MFVHAGSQKLQDVVQELRDEMGNSDIYDFCLRNRRKLQRCYFVPPPPFSLSLFRLHFLFSGRIFLI